MNYQQITSSINNKKLQPIYFLTGDESYYIDQITNKFANNILTQDEKEFNLTILYGKDIDVGLVSFLSVHKKLRGKYMAAVLIKKVMD